MADRGRGYHTDADVRDERSHVRLAEPHDLSLGFVARVEIGAARGSAQAAAQRIREDVIKRHSLHLAVGELRTHVYVRSLLFGFFGGGRQP